MNITVTQTNPLTLTAPHFVTNPVIKPVMQGNFLEEMPVTSTIHELLFKVTKDNDVFWVGAAVPLGTTDFTKIQVFFHPTVVQQQANGQVIVHAKETDYPAFTGGWPVYFSTTMFHRKFLPGGRLERLRGGFFPAVICPERTALNMVLPLRYWDPSLVARWDGGTGDGR